MDKENNTKICVKWYHPSTGFLKHNGDGVFSPSGEGTGIGGVVRNYSDDWITGFLTKAWAITIPWPN
ncbi:hypothetical protein RDI58_003892 [Solanum bulbocastanum]|uniref:Uncharacterized protein n=1 Tax=Solanum bulbocastanum TaxID=147425 RepID=A0AAN8U4S5_SOLBU